MNMVKGSFLKNSPRDNNDWNAIRLTPFVKLFEPRIQPYIYRQGITDQYIDIVTKGLFEAPHSSVKPVYTLRMGDLPILASQRMNP
jgi:hypothetical protein